MGRKFASQWAASTSALWKGEAVSGLGIEKTVATAMVAGAVVAFACTTKGAVPWWNAMSSRSTSGNTTISSMMNIRLVRMNTVDVLTFHRDIIRSVLPEIEQEVNPSVVPSNWKTTLETACIHAPWKGNTARPGLLTRVSPS